MAGLQKLVTYASKRLGRGHGSGRGKTAGRGTKGQKARGSIPQDFEGGQVPLTKRLPLLRGKGRNASQKERVVILTVGRLSVFPKGSTITVEALQKQGLIAEDVKRVKVLDSGTLSAALTVSVPCSKGAKLVIEKAGGTVTQK